MHTQSMSHARKHRLFYYTLYMYILIPEILDQNTAWKCYQIFKLFSEI